MIELHWTLLGFGIAGGAMAAGIFLAGLAAGIWLALRSKRPGPVLAVSATLRIAALLAFGWWVATLGQSALIGFALGFLGMRLAVLSVVRATDAPKDISCN